MKHADLAPTVMAFFLIAPGAPAQVPKPTEESQPSIVSPVRIAKGERGEILVTDFRNRSVVVLRKGSLRAARSFPVDGRPSAIGGLGQRIFVGNTSHQRVEIYSPDGAFLGVLGGARARVVEPRDLVIDPGRELLFVVDGGERDVKVFNLSTAQGERVGTIGGAGATVGLLHPTGIAVDPVAREVYVSDFGDLGSVDPRIVVYGFDGSVTGVIQSTAAAGSHFFRPQGLALSATGRVYVADSWFGRIVIMDRQTGLPVGSLGTYGTGPGELRLPLDLVIVGSAQDVLVTNNRAQRIEKFPQGGAL